MVNNTEEEQYLKLCKNILSTTTSKTGRNGETLSIFCPDILRFDLSNDKIPLLTTKKMFFRGIVEELLFFIRGDTNSKNLEKIGINIWNKNTSRDFLDSLSFNDRIEGMMGPMYGFQWRHFNGYYNENNGQGIGGIDQLKNLVEELKSNPNSRRHLLTDYNPSMVNRGVLYPCHSICIQFYVDQNKYLDMFCYNRSSDVFLGLPFNIASTSLFLRLIAEVTGYKARHVNISLGDAHIYDSHIDSVKEQIKRDPYQFPTLKINKKIDSIDDLEKLTYDNFVIENYKCYPTIKAEMIA